MSWRTRAFAARGANTSTVYVDSMALKFIARSRHALVRVTDPSPTAVIDTVSGSIPVDCIGVMGFNVVDHRGTCGTTSKYLMPTLPLALRLTCTAYNVPGKRLATPPLL